METLTTDYSGNGYTLTNENSVSQSPGKRGLAANWGNANERRLSLNGDMGLTGTGPITVSCLAKVISETTTDSDFYFGEIVGVGNYRYLRIIYYYNAGTRQIGGLHIGAGLNWCVKNMNIGDGKWRHMVLTFNSTDGQRFYLDGNLAASNSTTAGSNSTTPGNAVQLGGDRSMATKTTNGMSDEYLIDNTTFIPQKIKTLYSNYFGKLQC